MACCPACEQGLKSCPGKSGAFIPMEDALSAEQPMRAQVGQGSDRLPGAYGARDRWTVYDAVLIDETLDADSRLPRGFYFQ